MLKAVVAEVDGGRGEGEGGGEGVEQEGEVQTLLLLDQWLVLLVLERR